MLHAVARQAGPVRIRDRLITLIRPHGEILGVLALVDGRDEADEHTVLALEHAAASLALELTHLRNLAEVELRLHRELVDDLLAGTDEASATPGPMLSDTTCTAATTSSWCSGRTGPPTNPSHRLWGGRPLAWACARC